MRNVFSAIRRSLTSVAIVFASSKRGARRTSRSVRMHRVRLFRRISGAIRSDKVVTRASSKAKRGAGLPSPLLDTRVGPPVRWDPADLEIVYRLFGRRLGHRLNRYEYAALGFGPEFDAAVGQGKQRMIFGQADIGARVPFGAALARDNVAGENLLAAENLQAEPLTVRVAAVAGGSACFLVGHGFRSFVLFMCSRSLWRNHPFFLIFAFRFRLAGLLRRGFRRLFRGFG